MATRTQELEESIARDREKLKVKEARLQKAKAADKARKRKAEAHAKIVVGGMVLARVAERDGWMAVDLAKLDRYLDRYSRSIAELTIDDLPDGGTDEIDWTAANRRIRDWEKRRRENARRRAHDGREQKPAARAAADGGAGDAGSGREDGPEPDGSETGEWEQEAWR